MDSTIISIIAAGTMTTLQPYIHEFVEKAAGKLDSSMPAGIGELWSAIHKGMSVKDISKEALETWLKDPENKELQTMFKVQLEKQLGQDNAFAHELRLLLEETRLLTTYKADLKVEGAITQEEGTIAAVAKMFYAGGIVGDDFIGRDKILDVLNVLNINFQRDASGNLTITGDNNTVILDPTHTDLDLLLQVYYFYLANECRRLPLGVIDSEFVRCGYETQVTLPNIYVDMDVVTPSVIPSHQDEEKQRDWTMRLERGESEERTPLLQLITEYIRKGVLRTVLIGNVGTGKTTFVNYLTYLMVMNTQVLPEMLQGLLPVRLVLREVAEKHIPDDAYKGSAKMLWNALRADIAHILREDIADDLLSKIRERLIKDGGIILLDGLDEVSLTHQCRQKLVQAIRELVAALPDVHFLVTARSYAYGEPNRILDDFTVLALAPFNQKQINRFIDRWYQAVRLDMGWNEDTAWGKGEKLQLVLGERSYLADLASCPLLLTLIAALHSIREQLPEDRASLYEETVRLLLSHGRVSGEGRRSSGDPEGEHRITQVLGADDKNIRSALETLAFNIHKKQRIELEDQEIAADITESDILLAFEPLFSTVGPDELVEDLSERSGLLNTRREGVFTFAHRSFQEYLAACHLTGRGNLAEEIQNLLEQSPKWWREVFLFGVGKLNQGGLDSPVSVLSYILPTPEEVEKISDYHWQIAMLVGQALVDLRLTEKVRENPKYSPILHRTRHWLVRLVEGGYLATRERVDGGDVLGKLGDLRFNPETWSLPAEPKLGFIEIPEGSFLMGGDPNKDANTQEREQPQHEVYLPTYYIARYPVTVAQFCAFVEDSGYKPKDQESLQGTSNHPVVNVTWYDAVAYCEWVTKKLCNSESTPQHLAELLRKGWRVTLPSEAEWEKAARGASRDIYSWGNEYDPEKTNIEETGIGTTSAVGCFPLGASPSDVLDMIGNVWEWTRSLWGKEVDEPDFRYPYEIERKREYLEAPDNVLRVVRGGSFLSSQKRARCSSRSGDPPGYWFGNGGFRIAISPFSEQAMVRS